MLLRLMFVDRGGSAAGRKARVEGIRESEKAMERRKRELSMVLFGCGCGTRGLAERFEMACGQCMKNEEVPLKHELVLSKV